MGIQGNEVSFCLKLKRLSVRVAKHTTNDKEISLRGESIYSELYIFWGITLRKNAECIVIFTCSL